MQTYRTYSDKIITEYRTTFDSSFNKPRGGLWGCRGREWKNWCTIEEFPCADTYFEWRLKKDVKVFTIDNENDFACLIVTYPRYTSSSDVNGVNYVDSIDFMKLWEDGYGAVELTENANNKLHFGFNIAPKNVMIAQAMNKQYYTATIMALNAWDVPSICVFDPSNSIVIISDLKVDNEVSYVNY